MNKTLIAILAAYSLSACSGSTANSDVGNLTEDPTPKSNSLIPIVSNASRSKLGSEGEVMQITLSKYIQDNSDDTHTFKIEAPDGLEYTLSEGVLRVFYNQAFAGKSFEVGFYAVDSLGQQSNRGIVNFSWQNQLTQAETSQQIIDRLFPQPEGLTYRPEDLVNGWQDRVRIYQLSGELNDQWLTLAENNFIRAWAQRLAKCTHIKNTIHVTLTTVELVTVTQANPYGEMGPHYFGNYADRVSLLKMIYGDLVSQGKGRNLTLTPPECKIYQ